jgi:hypothetical protein
MYDCTKQHTAAYGRVSTKFVTFANQAIIVMGFVVDGVAFKYQFSVLELLAKINQL